MGFGTDGVTLKEFQLSPIFAILSDTFYLVFFISDLR